MTVVPEPSAAAKAMLAGYAAHVAAQRSDDDDAQLQSILRRIDRGEEPLPLDDAPARPRSRRAVVLALATTGALAAIAAAVALWLPHAGRWDATAASEVDPQAAYQHDDVDGGELVQGTALGRATQGAAVVRTDDAPVIATADPPATAPTIDAPNIEPTAAVSPAAGAGPTPRPRSRVARAPVTPSAAAAPVADAADELAQVRMLAQARTALRDGDAAGALARLEADRRAHPSSAYA